ncbi:MAG: M48 family metallopeptidase [Ruminiclostridium sp.]|nr:M48 family metallopeptidase [Ruminiclostridium sp.]MBP3521014.1 M48 family metallopeptidase [Oscillospiraceae bacterium]
MELNIIRTRRKTISMTLKPDGLEVRAPLWMPEGQIGQFIDAHRDWIQKAWARQEKRRQELEKLPRLTEEELQELAEKARAYLPERVSFYAPKIGVSYGKITVKRLRSRWGSCSARGNLNFNCLLMLAPPQVIDSVVVHELCHRKEMNHSERFYREVLRAFPDYRECRRWLKEHGDAILSRAPEK